MTAEVPPRSPITPLFEADPPAAGVAGWMRWFQNARCGAAFDRGTKSADFSLQLSIGIPNFYTWKDTLDGLFASSYQPQPTTRLFASPHAKLPAAPGKTVYQSCATCPCRRNSAGRGRMTATDNGHGVEDTE